ncbi:hypothetical protein ACWECC_27175, partial [Streptomyces microflavus]
MTILTALSFTQPGRNFQTTPPISPPIQPMTALRRLVPPATAVLKAVDTWLREYQPTTVLYFSGS